MTGTLTASPRLSHELEVCARAGLDAGHRREVAAGLAGAVGARGRQAREGLVLALDLLLEQRRQDDGCGAAVLEATDAVESTARWARPRPRSDAAAGARGMWSTRSAMAYLNSARSSYCFHFRVTASCAAPSSASPRAGSLRSSMRYRSSCSA